jgi:hypothetical protein
MISTLETSPWKSFFWKQHFVVWSNCFWKQGYLQSTFQYPIKGSNDYKRRYCCLLMVVLALCSGSRWHLRISNHLYRIKYKEKVQKLKFFILGICFMKCSWWFNVEWLHLLQLTIWKITNNQVLLLSTSFLMNLSFLLAITMNSLLFLILFN